MLSSGSSSPSIPSPQQAASAPRRRLACDRCHAQKLRCLRTVNPEIQVCDRCLRLSAECVYSPSCRIGRPRRRPSEATTNSRKKLEPRKISIQKDDGQPPDPQSTLPQCAAASTLDSQSPEMVSAMGFDINDVCNSGFLEFLDNSVTLGPVNTPPVDPGALPWTFFDGFSERTGIQPEGYPCDPGLEDYVRELADLSVVLHTQLETVERARGISPQGGNVLVSRLRDYPITAMFENTQKLVSIATRLADTSTVPEARYNPTCGIDGGAVHVPINDFSGSVGGQSSGSSVDSSSLFDALTEHGSAWSANVTPFPTSTELPPPHRTTSPTAKVDTSTVLLLLSCYTALVRLYTSFCLDLRELLFSGSLMGLSCLFPDLKLGSFQALTGMGMDAVLVAQASTHLIDRLHKARNDCVAAGLINSSLLHAVQIQEEIDAQKHGRFTYKDLAGLMKDIRKLLQTRFS